MTQYLIMAAIVLWAVLYSAWAFMPSAARRAAAARISGWARRLGLGEQEARGLQASLAKPSSCGACSSCAGCSKPGVPGSRAMDVVRNAPPR
ncbi:MAG: hypothetical protein Q8Q73_01245 [Stagnimonas sp.]|nr:hypothetical protein [Stagnimonas sp.]